MNRILVLAAALLLSACQQGGADTRSVATADNARSSANREFVLPDIEQKLDRLQGQMSARLMMLCAASSTVEAMTDCYHRQMLVAFDIDGVVGDHCAPQADLKADFICIGTSSFTFSVAKKAGGEALANFDWSDLKGSLKVASNQIVAGHLQECLALGSGSDPKHCLAEALSKTLGLTDGDVQRCAPVGDDHTFGRCLGELYFHKSIVEALARLEELSA